MTCWVVPTVSKVPSVTHNPDFEVTVLLQMPSTYCMRDLFAIAKFLVITLTGYCWGGYCFGACQACFCPSVSTSGCVYSVCLCVLWNVIQARHTYRATCDPRTDHTRVLYAVTLLPGTITALWRVRAARYALTSYSSEQPYVLSPVHTSNKFEFNTVDFVERATNRQQVERSILLPVCSATTWIFMSHVMIQSLVTSFR